MDLSTHKIAMNTETSPFMKQTKQNESLYLPRPRVYGWATGGCGGRWWGLLEYEVEIPRKKISHTNVKGSIRLSGGLEHHDCGDLECCRPIDKWSWVIESTSFQQSGKTRIHHQPPLTQKARLRAPFLELLICALLNQFVKCLDLWPYLVLNMKSLRKTTSMSERVIWSNLNPSSQSTSTRACLKIAYVWLLLRWKLYLPQHEGCPIVLPHASALNILPSTAGPKGRWEPEFCCLGEPAGLYSIAPHYLV